MDGIIWKRISRFWGDAPSGPKQVKKALERAQRFQARFYQSLLHRGKEILDRVEPNEKAMVIVGRPYNSCDSAVNLDIPKKLRDLGVLSIPMDFLLGF
jgi:predicted nucleotide-binding protein (sugar kinase/HSP70/actin superfamily)